MQSKDCLPAASLRKILAIQADIVKITQQTPLDRNNIANPLPQQPAPAPAARQPNQPRALLSANFGIAAPMQNGARAANALGRNILSAGDRLREMIAPEALANVVMAPAGWIPGINVGGGARRRDEKDAEKRAEKLRQELEDILAGSCPLCESVVVGVNQPFVKEGEVDTSWEL